MWYKVGSWNGCVIWKTTFIVCISMLIYCAVEHCSLQAIVDDSQQHKDRCHLLLSRSRRGFRMIHAKQFCFFDSINDAVLHSGCSNVLITYSPRSYLSSPRWLLSCRW